MPSFAYDRWATIRKGALDHVEAAHAAIRTTSPSGRQATRLINHAYAVILAAEFQGFCRDLHTEAVSFLVRPLAVSLRVIVEDEFSWNRQLDRSNATPSSLGTDFGRLGIDLWKLVDVAYPQGPLLRRKLEELNSWRNAIAHSDFDPVRLGGTILRLQQVRRWRWVCARLARILDRIVTDGFFVKLGSRPWD